MRAALIGLVIASLSAAQDRPNILLVVTDDQRWDHLGLSHPHLKTPSMDGLAASGVRFRQAFVTTSICAASRASLLTGCFERTHGYSFGTPPLARRYTDTAWPRLLRDSGYHTGYVGKFGVRVEKGAAKEMFDVFRSRGAPYWKKQRDGSRRHLTDITGDDARSFIKNAPADKPWALVVGFNAPHAEDSNPRQFIWPETEDQLYEDVDVPQPPLADPQFFADQPEFIKKSLNRIRWKWRFDTEEKRQRMTKGYWRMISAIDRNLLAIEQANDGPRETVVIFMSDNGYFLGDRGFAGKWLPYEASLRVPLIIKGVRGTRRLGGTRDQTVLNIDIAPTICALVGVEAPASYQGKSLVPILKGETPPWRQEFFFEHLFDHKDIPKLEGVRTGQYKYVRYFQQDPPHEELYEHTSDGLEVNNLVGDPKMRPILQRLRARCDSLRERYKEQRERKRTRRSKKRPNVVMIIGDDQHWSDYGFMGSETVKTPNLDRLARQGLVFERGYVPSSLCCPSLASLATGLLPHRHRITGNEPPRPSKNGPVRDRAGYQRQVREMIKLIDEVDTLPRMLRRHGYWSQQTGKWWLGNYRRGGFTHGMTHGDPKRRGRHGDDGLRIGREGLDEVWDFVEQADDRPFLLWYAPFLPHTPHNPPPRLLELYESEAPTIHIARYRAMCTWLDETVGQLLKGLEERGLADETLFVFSCDNGWIQRETRGGFAPRSKRSPYDGGLRTPIVIRWRGRVEPGRVSKPVMSTDIVSTVLAALGLEIPDDLGIDLLDKDAVSLRGPLLSAVFRHNAVDIQRPEANLTHRWAVEGRWKLILPRKGEAEFYDVVGDPSETTNVVGAHGDRVAALRQQLDRWWPAAR